MKPFTNTPKNRATVLRKAKEIYIKDQELNNYQSIRGLCYSIMKAFEQCFDMDMFDQRDHGVYTYDYIFGSANNFPEFMVFVKKHNPEREKVYWVDVDIFGVGRRRAMFDLMIADADERAEKRSKVLKEEDITPQFRIDIYKEAKKWLVKHNGSSGICNAILYATCHKYNLSLNRVIDLGLRCNTDQPHERRNFPEFIVFHNKYDNDDFDGYWFEVRGEKKDFNLGRRVAIMDKMIAMAESEIV